MTWTGSGGIASGGEVVDWVPGPGTDEKEEAILGLDDLRFRRQFNLALVRLRRKGEISGDEYRRYRGASFNELAIKDGKAFIQCLRDDCEAKAKAQGLMDDLVKWWEWLVDWIVENWKTILQVVLSLLVFLG